MKFMKNIKNVEFINHAMTEQEMRTFVGVCKEEEMTDRERLERFINEVEGWHKEGAFVSRQTDAIYVCAKAELKRIEDKSFSYKSESRSIYER